MARVDLDEEHRGDTVAYGLTLTKEGASAGWAIGASLLFVAKFSPADADAAVTASTDDGGIEWVDDTLAAPTATLMVRPDAWSDALLGHVGTITLYYDLEITDADGVVETLQWGEWPILPDNAR